MESTFDKRSEIKMATNEKEKNATPMWRLQAWFQLSVSQFANEVFEQLDPKLSPRFLIVGIPDDEKLTACLEPTKESGYEPAFFADVMRVAKEIETAKAAKDAWKYPQGEPRELTISSKSIQEAISKTLNAPESTNVFVSYCSEPVIVGSFSVSCVLQFDATVFPSHFSVPVEWLFDGRLRLPGSLIDATAVAFLRVCQTVLSGPRKTFDHSNPLGYQAEDILRMGGRELMWTANHIGTGTTFDDINKLSWKTHEGELAGGEIHFIHWDNYHLDMPVNFKDTPKLSNIDAARKLIEMAGAKNRSHIDSKLSLVSHGHTIDGIGGVRELENEYDEYNSHVFIVKFKGYYHWELWVKGIDLPMMQVISGVPSLPREPISKEKFKDHIRRTFTQSSFDEHALWNIVHAAADQKHGTMILISSAAAQEAERLEEQSTVLKEPVKLVDDLLKETLLMLTSIDGALLVDPSGVCYAAGVILDGKAIKGKGTSSRGARYNSAIRYVYGVRHDDDGVECLAVVVSKDGGINLVRELRQRISRLEITKQIEKLRSAVATEPINAKDYSKAIFWLNDNRFYLSPELCNELNKIKKAPGLPIDVPDFIPDEEMDDSYFIDSSGLTTKNSE